MKKSRVPTSWESCIIPWSKILKMMKVVLFIMLVAAIHVSANTYSQNTRFNLNMKNVSIKQVLEEIEYQSEFRFLYSDTKINVERKVDVHFSNNTIEEVLQKILVDSGISYKVIERQILLTNTKDSFPTEKQDKSKVTGKITDSKGSPLPGVTVVIKGTTNGTVTNANGEYSLSDIPGTAVLQFSFVGMKTQEVPLEGKTTINIVMEEEAIGIEEVVAIGYGTQQRREVSGSITNVAEKNFNKGVNRDAVDLLQGKVAGLSITQGSGDVSSDKTIRLRGTSSLTGSSEPFVVIDGIPGLSLNSVAPQDIESISILKDASASAIYGSRSASGVIMITTKKGKLNQSSINYNGYIATDFVSNKPDVLTASEWRNYCTENNVDTEGFDYGANTDWFDEIMRVGITQNHDISLSGGGNKHSYRASITYQDREGVVKDNYMTRLNSRLTFNQRALEDHLNVTVTGAFSQRDYSPTNTNNFVLAYNMLPVYPVKNDDGSWFDSEEYDQGNPVRNIKYNSHEHKNNLYYINIKSDLTLFNNLVLGINALKERETDDYGAYNNSETEAGRDDNGYAEREFWSKDKKLLETTINYSLELNDNKFNFLGGYSYEENYYQLAGAQNRGFATDLTSYNDLSAGEDLQSGDVWSEANMSKLISFFGRVNYSLKEKYILTATLRRDGSSKFGANHKWGTFPSISAAWRIIDEPFMAGTNIFDELKLRAGYGVAGNQEGLDPYLSLELYGVSGQYYDNGEWYTAYTISQNANPDLKWEETSMFNVGIDYSLFNRRIYGSLEYYNKKTTDLLYTYEVPVPPYLYSEMVANVGDMSNKGIEFSVSGDIIRKSDFRWTMSVNMSHNKNEITSLSNEYFSTEAVKTGDAWIRGGSDNTTHIIEEGKEVGTFYGWKCYGLDEDGDYIMDESVDGEEGLSDEDKTYIGSAQPKLTYGISNSITYKKFELSFFLRGVLGNDVLNFSKMSYATTQWLPGANVLHEALTNGLTAVPQYCSYYIEKGSFLRLDNASLGYNIDTKNLWGVSNMRVFITTQNLFTITKYTGLDPEVDMSGLDPGVEGREYYPKSRTFTLGVSLNF